MSEQLMVDHGLPHHQGVLVGISEMAEAAQHCIRRNLSAQLLLHCMIDTLNKQIPRRHARQK